MEYVKSNEMKGRKGTTRTCIILPFHEGVVVVVVVGDLSHEEGGWVVGKKSRNAIPGTGFSHHYRYVRIKRMLPIT